MRKRIISIFLAAAIILSLLASCTKATGVKSYIGQPEEQKPQPSAEVTASRKILDSMSLDEKIGQLVIVGFPQGTSQQQVKDYIAKYKVGGFILFKRNYKSFEELYNLCRTLKEWNTTNPMPLFLSVDEEGGTVSRLPAGGTKFPDAQLVGKTGKPDVNYEIGKTIGKELNAAGINLNFAPVLDILVNKNSTLLIKRSYGSTPDIASAFGGQFISGLQSQGIIAAPKHFPGHGATSIDSHGKLPVINIDSTTLHSRELVPYMRCMASGLDAVMVGHLAFPKIDPSGVPATMSPVFLKNILRDELGFKGIAITDEIEMYGFMSGKKTLEASVVAAFNAGVDVFIIGHTRSVQERAINALKEGIRNGSISETRLNESVQRIIEVKLKYKLSNSMSLDLPTAKKQFGSKEDKAVLDNVLKLINNKSR